MLISINNQLDIARKFNGIYGLHEYNFTTLYAFREKYIMLVFRDKTYLYDRLSKILIPFGIYVEKDIFDYYDIEEIQYPKELIRKQDIKFYSQRNPDIIVYEDNVLYDNIKLKDFTVIKKVTVDNVSDIFRIEVNNPDNIFVSAVFLILKRINYFGNIRGFIYYRDNIPLGYILGYPINDEIDFIFSLKYNKNIELSDNERKEAIFTLLSHFIDYSSNKNFNISNILDMYNYYKEIFNNYDYCYRYYISKEDYVNYIKFEE